MKTVDPMEMKVLANDMYTLTAFIFFSKHICMFQLVGTHEEQVYCKYQLIVAINHVMDSLWVPQGSHFGVASWSQAVIVLAIICSKQSPLNSIGSYSNS